MVYGCTQWHVLSATMHPLQCGGSHKGNARRRKIALACASQTNKLSRAAPHLTVQLATVSAVAHAINYDFPNDRCES